MLVVRRSWGWMISVRLYLLYFVPSPFLHVIPTVIYVSASYHPTAADACATRDVENLSAGVTFRMVGA